MIRNPFVWSSEPPRKVGLWWHRYSDQHDPSVVSIYLDEGGEWSMQYGDLDQDPEDERASVNWLENLKGSQFAGPIPVPREP